MLQTRAIAAQIVREDSAFDTQAQPLGQGRFDKQRSHRFDDADHIDRCLAQRDLAGLDLGQIENIVDDVEQMFTCCRNLVQTFALP